MSNAGPARPMIAVTVGVGPYYGEMARRAAERVHALTGLPTRVLGDDEYRAHVDARHIEAMGPMASTALKLKVFDLCPGFDDVLFFDADLVWLAPWDPREAAGTSRFVCVRDSWYLDFIQAEAAELGVPLDRYFNTGFFIASREAHAAAFATAYARFGECYETRRLRLFDQSLMNLVFHELGVPLRFLDRRYNFLGYALDSEAALILPALAAHCVRRRIRDPDKHSTMAFLRGEVSLPSGPRREIDLAVARELSGRMASFGPPGGRAARVELREDFTIGLGWSADVAFWYPLADAGGTRLMLFSRDFVTCALRREGDGAWRGRFPALHARPGGTPRLAPATWRHPRLLVRVLRAARRTVQRALRRGALGRIVELRPEP